MKRAVVLQHVAFEGPVKLAPLLAERGYTIDVVRLDLGASVPVSLPAQDVLVVMGGPMGVEDVERPEYPFLRPELALLRERLAQDAPVLGVCLGAQLLAAVAGARVQPMTQPDGSRCYEVGWGPVQLHSRGASDPILGGLPAEALVLHWHGDACELPAGARLLASTPVCSTQAFQLRTRLFGLQFHCEVDPNAVEGFLRADADYVTRANGPHGVEQIRRDTERSATAAWAVGERLLRNMLDAMTRGA